MPKYNEGFKEMHEYLLAKIQRRAASKGQDLIQLASANPDLDTPDTIQESVAKVANEYHPEPSSAGIPELREAISGHYMERFGVHVPPENIIVGHGIKSDLGDVGRAFSNRGDWYVLPDAGYPIIANTGRFEGRILKHSRYTQDGKIEIPDKVLDRERLALVYLCNPNNPDGVLIEPPEISSLAAKVGRAGALLLSDIAYADFQLLGDVRSPSVFQAEGAKDIAIELGGFKAYSMTGHRVSWFASLNENMLRYWQRFKSNRDKGTPVAMQVAALTALTDKTIGLEIQKYMTEYADRASIMKKGLEEMGLEVRGLEHTPFAWVHVPSGFSSEGFTDLLLDNASVCVVPGNGFGPGGEGYVRISIFQPRDTLEEALSRIRRTL